MFDYALKQFIRRRVIERGLADINDMLVFHASRQSGVSACSHNNGGCQHLCLSLHNGRHTCSCPAHYTLNADNVTCTGERWWEKPSGTKNRAVRMFRVLVRADSNLLVNNWCDRQIYFRQKPSTCLVCLRLDPLEICASGKRWRSVLVDKQR